MVGWLVGSVLVVSVAAVVGVLSLDSDSLTVSAALAVAGFGSLHWGGVGNP